MTKNARMRLYVHVSGRVKQEAVTWRGTDMSYHRRSLGRFSSHSVTYPDHNALHINTHSYISEYHHRVETSFLNTLDFLP